MTVMMQRKYRNYDNKINFLQMKKVDNNQGRTSRKSEIIKHYKLIVSSCSNSLAS